MHPAEMDFNQKPFLVIWETTQACDLACMHCRAEAEPNPKPDELTHEEGLKLIDDVAEMGVPILVLSGGDPLKRKDLLECIHHGKKRRLRMGTIPAATPLLTQKVVRSLKEADLDQMALSLDASTQEAHDTFRGVPGAFAKTMEAVQWAHEADLPLQINTVMTRHNFEDADRLIALVQALDIVFWEVFFLVQTGRGTEITGLTADEVERVFEKLYHVSQNTSFILKVTEAPHYRRYFIQQRLREEGIDPHQVAWQGGTLPPELRRVLGPRGSIGRAPQGVNAGKGFVFVAHNGEVFPSGFLPLSAGNVRTRHLRDIYQQTDLFRALRDPGLLKGRCGRCEYRYVCGGSRSRAYAATEDYLATDPACSYEPQKEALTLRR